MTSEQVVPPGQRASVTMSTRTDTVISSAVQWRQSGTRRWSSGRSSLNPATNFLTIAVAAAVHPVSHSPALQYPEAMPRFIVEGRKWRQRGPKRWIRIGKEERWSTNEGKENDWADPAERGKMDRKKGQFDWLVTGRRWVISVDVEAIVWGRGTHHACCPRGHHSHSLAFTTVAPKNLLSRHPTFPRAHCSPVPALVSSRYDAPGCQERVRRPTQWVKEAFSRGADHATWDPWRCHVGLSSSDAHWEFAAWPSDSLASLSMESVVVPRTKHMIIGPTVGVVKWFGTYHLNGRTRVRVTHTTESS